jgi:hypothetical protein
MEPLFYEIKPWFFAIVSLWAMVYASNSTIQLYSGALLAFAAALIIHARFANRSGRIK